ncbi:MAG: hypothetical protein J7J06_05200 [Methanosarcinales archaeon]|nr:hypothetical protein [Methanosarcinales archaeon]
MDEPIRKSDISNIGEKISELSDEQRRTRVEILEKIDESSSTIVAAVFSESRGIREEIGYQTMMLKMLGDNLREIQPDETAGVSSRVEVSIGADIYGNGAKWILDIDTTKSSYSDFLHVVQRTSGIPKEIKERAKLRIEKLVQWH